MEQHARQGLEIGVGLAVLGVQRWLLVRPGVEAELDRLGFATTAEASRKLGDALSRAMIRLATPASRR